VYHQGHQVTDDDYAMRLLTTINYDIMKMTSTEEKTLLTAYH